MQRVIKSYNCVGHFVATRLMTNVAYGYWIIQKTEGSAYDSSLTAVNKINEFAFNDEGVLGLCMSEKQKLIADAATRIQKTEILSNGIPLAKTSIV